MSNSDSGKSSSSETNRRKNSSDSLSQISSSNEKPLKLEDFANFLISKESASDQKIIKRANKEIDFLAQKLKDPEIIFNKVGQTLLLHLDTIEVSIKINDKAAHKLKRKFTEEGHEKNGQAENLNPIANNSPKAQNLNSSENFAMQPSAPKKQRTISDISAEIAAILNPDADRLKNGDPVFNTNHNISELQELYMSKIVELVKTKFTPHKKLLILQHKIKADYLLSEKLKFLTEFINFTLNCTSWKNFRVNYRLDCHDSTTWKNYLGLSSHGSMCSWNTKLRWRVIYLTLSHMMFFKQLFYKLEVDVLEKCYIELEKFNLDDWSSAIFWVGGWKKTVKKNWMGQT